MKIWHEHSADHSAKLKIIGTFKTIDDANLAKSRIDDIVNLMQQQLTYTNSGDTFPAEILDYITQNNFIISKSAMESAELYHDIEQTGKTIEVNTDETDIQLFIESFINCGGKIEVFSKHDY
ncbi:DUF6375 family protein [Aliarcobacter cryaerophilus]|uniref:Uncharacterized protein n=1 Tax=Aliarcobacter cryaerophilus TaxID=28198 RepID=A0A2S9TR90_9BACT|nr:DUF6375 family protein [Aliarcobacter cryaerophilus]PRN01350.1 hypothetical protein CJ668_02465 [Arcobacter cryaerophilus gv. pseudocryaerophilus]